MDYAPLSSHVPAMTLPHLIEAMKRFNINSVLRVSHFVSQCAHESNGFYSLQESLNYSADALLRVFPKYFTPETAKEYEHKGEKIANRVYANRMGNDNEASGDGYRYRGRGYIMCTGKDNYQSFGMAIGEGIVTNPNLLTTNTYASLSSAWYWDSRKLNSIADKGATEQIVKEATRKINGGYIGLSDRLKRFNEIYSLWSK